MAKRRSEKLFVRVDLEFMRDLDALVLDEQRRHPGRDVTRSEMAREILYQGLKDRRRQRG